MKNYETELPHNYKLIKTIDAQKSSVGLVLNLIALARGCRCRSVFFNRRSV